MKENYRIIINKLFNAGLLLLVFLLPLQTRWIVEQGMVGENPNEFLTVSLYGVDILIVLILLFKIYTKLYNKNPKEKGLDSRLRGNDKVEFLFQRRMLMIIWLFILWNVLSVFWSTNKMLAMQHAAWLLLAIGLGWLIATSKNKIILMHTILVGLTLSAWLGIWQFITQTTFSSKWLGLALHEAKQGGTSVVETFAGGQGARWLRAYGSFDHPNIFGAAMVIGIFLLIWLAMEYEKKRTFENIKKEIFISSIFFVMLIGFATACFLSLSRSAWVGLGFGLIAMMAQKKWRNRKIRAADDEQWIVLLKSLFVVIVIFLFMGFVYKDLVLVRTQGSTRLEEKSLDDRAVFFQQGREIIKNNLFLGVGAGNYIETVRKANPGSPSWAYQPVHNVFLLVWAELGIVGMLVLLTLMFAAVGNVWQSGNVLGIALLASLAPTLLLDHWLWSLHFGVLFLGLIIGLISYFTEDRFD